MGLALKATLTFTFEGAGQVHTVTPQATDVRFSALVHINTLQTAMLHHMFVTMTTVAFVTSIHIDAVTSAIATGFRLTFIIILADVPLRVEMVTRVTVTDVAIKAVLALSMTTNISAQLTLICVDRDFGLRFKRIVAWSYPDDGRRRGLDKEHSRGTDACGSWLSYIRPFRFGSINQGLSEVLDEVSFSSGTDLIEGRCAHLRTPLTVAAPSLAHSAAAHF